MLLEEIVTSVRLYHLFISRSYAVSLRFLVFQPLIYLALLFLFLLCVEGNSHTARHGPF